MQPAADSQPATLHGVVLTLAVLAAMHLLDVAFAVVNFIATLCGLVPPVAATTSVAVRGAMLAVVLGSKLYLLLVLVRAPQRLAWIARSWTAPMVLAVLAVASLPAAAVVSALDTLAIQRAYEPLRNGVGSSSIGEVMANWMFDHVALQWVASLTTAAIWAGMLLYAYHRAALARR